MRGQPAPLAPLTEAQRRFAEQHHGLVYAFLRENGHSAAEYYDAAALGFLQAVQRYLTQPWLRRYAFPTVAWRAMGRGVATEHRAQERQRDAERRYLETMRAAPPNLYAELETQLIFHDLMAGASEEQHRLALMRLRGSSMSEAARAQGMGVKRARRLLKELHSDYLLLNSEQERGINFNEYGRKDN